MKKIVWISFGLCAAYWVAESMVDSLIFGMETFFQRLLYPDQQEVWMRATTMSLIVAFGLYVSHKFEKQKETDAKLIRMNACFLDFGPDPVENVNRLTVLCSELLGASAAFYFALDREVFCSSKPTDKPRPGAIADESASDVCPLLSESDELQVTRGPDLDPACPAREMDIPESSTKTCMRKSVKLGKKWVGVLCVVFAESYAPSDDDKRLMSIIASAIGVEEVRRRSQVALRKSEEQLRHLSSELITAQEVERKQLARQLHDSIGQSVSALKFSIEGTLEVLNNEVSEEKLKSLSASVPLVREIVAEIRRLQVDLYPPTLDELGIVAAINSFCKQYRDIYRDTRVETHIEVSESEVPKPFKMVIYRIMQEAMNNIAKHSGASQISLSLRKGNDLLRLVIQDNGAGFDSRYAGHFMKGLGLSSMKERAELSGGTFLLDSERGNGTKIAVSWHLSENGISRVST